MFDIDFAHVVLMYGCLLFSLCVHEAAHAAMANHCGDPSAKLMGRLTLDPRKHIDPIGTVLMPLLMLTMQVPYLFGWAKPVPFNPRNLNNIKRDPVYIAMAGPASNLLIALACAFILRIIMHVPGINPNDVLGIIIQFLTNENLGAPGADSALGISVLILFALIMINLLLMAFNLIPVPPLDGHYVLHFFLPPSGQRMLEQIGPFGILIVIIFIAPNFLPPVMNALMSGVFFLLTVGM